jgi:23S rRNA (adenine2503-C2)-methyltransferase
MTIDRSSPILMTPPTATATAPLLGMDLSDLTHWMTEHGEPAYRGKQLHQWLYQKGVRSLSDITVFSKEWRAQMAEVPVGRSTIHRRSVAPDGTVKYLLQLTDGQIIEAVGIPTDKRLTVCISSQVGCAMACNFCATGKGGFQRHLQVHEMVDQVLTVQNDFQERVSHVVLMGMGEPLANFERTIAAIKCLNQDVGIGQRSITLSTVGIPGCISQLADHRLQITLAVSLHAPNQRLREQLIPTAVYYPIGDLMAECREYVNATGRRLSFEYIMLAGVNDHPDLAYELADLMRGFQAHVNLIPYNPIDEADYQRPSRQRIQNFVRALESQRVAVSVRYSKGLEADAACGQLRATKQPELS